jgi:hypothetical protein
MARTNLLGPFVKRAKLSVVSIISYFCAQARWHFIVQSFSYRASDFLKSFLKTNPELSYPNSCKKESLVFSKLITNLLRRLFQYGRLSAKVMSAFKARPLVTWAPLPPKMNVRLS